MKYKFGVGEKKDQEAPVKDNMIDTKGPPQHPPLAESVNQHIFKALTDFIKAVFVSTQRYQTKTTKATPAE